MKTKYYFGALAALALGLTACSSDDPEVNPANPTQGDRYMAVNISTFGDNSRALPGDDEFENGTDAECAITEENIRFYFFSEGGAPYVMSLNNINGTISNVNMVAPTAIQKHQTPGETSTSITGKLVLGTPSNGYEASAPALVVAVANPSGFTFEDLANKTFAEMQTKMASVSDLNLTTFTMTSSTYSADGKTVFATSTDGKIKETAAAAEADPAEIYLDRLAAKVRVKGLQTYTVKKKNDQGELVDDTFKVRFAEGEKDVTLSVELTGWQLINTATDTWAIKNIEGLAAKEPFAYWNDVLRHRCYWEVSPTKQTVINKTFSLSDAAQFKLGNDAISYTYPLTGIDPASATDRTKEATAIMVKGIVKAQLEGQTALTAFNFVKWGGEYFEYNYFVDVVKNAWKQEKGTEAGEVTLVADGQNKNLYKVQVGGENFDRFQNITWWNQGVTSYRANILHADGLYGVVRNHVYDYTFENVIGLGVPGVDPYNPDPETETYLAAVVNVLKWHIVSRNVNLGE